LAEGIEHPEDLAFLKGMGCQEGQGYHFGKAMPLQHWFPNLTAAAPAPALETVELHAKPEIATTALKRSA
jgi:EAL domain-containing protein (putative c-di-GMP-specific phosphodiesterase class I)